MPEGLRRGRRSLAPGSATTRAHLTLCSRRLSPVPVRPALPLQAHSGAGRDREVISRGTGRLGTESQVEDAAEGEGLVGMRTLEPP